MTEQLALLEIPVAVKPLTDRQQYALDHVTQAGTDGLHTDEVGALLCERNGKHAAGDRCQFDGRNGKEVLNALRTKGLVRYRAKLKVWQSVSTSELPGEPDSEPTWSGDGPVPYGVIPY